MEESNLVSRIRKTALVVATLAALVSGTTVCTDVKNPVRNNPFDPNGINYWAKNPQIAMQVMPDTTAYKRGFDFDGSPEEGGWFFYGKDGKPGRFVYINGQYFPDTDGDGKADRLTSK